MLGRPPNFTSKILFQIPISDGPWEKQKPNPQQKAVSYHGIWSQEICVCHPEAILLA